MDYTKLTESYWNKQKDRLSSLISKINEDPITATLGRIVPAEEDLTLGTGRTLRAAVMFTDICGFSVRRADLQSDQNVLLNILNLYFSEMIRIAEEYGGTVEKNTGDGLMAYFEDNTGEPPEKGCQRAISAALTMIYVNDHAISEVLTSSGIDPIKFRVGIDYGTITIAQIGAPRRFGGLVAIGTTANIASKMLSKASDGEILIGANVHQELPSTRQQWCHAHAESGFIYVSDGRPYWLYKYTGRWMGPM